MNGKVLAIVAVAVLLAGAAGSGIYLHKSASSYNCTAGKAQVGNVPMEACATDTWYNDLEEYDALQRKVLDFQKSAAYLQNQHTGDLANGIASRLNGQIPHGYDWNRDKKKFVLKPEADQYWSTPDGQATRKAYGLPAPK